MIKTDFRNMSESREFRQKTEQNSLEMPSLLFKKKKKNIIYWKTKNSNQFSLEKISYNTNFICFTTKSALGSTSESKEFRFENCLKAFSTDRFNTLPNWIKCLK